MTGTPVTSGAGIGVGTLITATATCDPGKVALGGGARITDTSLLGNALVSLRSSYPSATNTWTAVAIVNVALPLLATATVTPYVLCSL